MPHRLGHRAFLQGKLIWEQDSITKQIGSKSSLSIEQWGRISNPEVGFLGRTDCICDYADVNFKPRPKIRGVRDL